MGKIILHEYTFESVYGKGSDTQVSINNTFTTSLYTDGTGSTSLSGEETRPKNVYVNYIIYVG